MWSHIPIWFKKMFPFLVTAGRINTLLASPPIPPAENLGFLGIVFWIHAGVQSFFFLVLPNLSMQTTERGIRNLLFANSKQFKPGFVCFCHWNTSYFVGKNKGQVIEEQCTRVWSILWWRWNKMKMYAADCCTKAHMAFWHMTDSFSAWVKLVAAFNPRFPAAPMASMARARPVPWWTIAFFQSMMGFLLLTVTDCVYNHISYSYIYIYKLYIHTWYLYDPGLRCASAKDLVPARETLHIGIFGGWEGTHKPTDLGCGLKNLPFTA